MNISPTSSKDIKQPAFGHGNPWSDSPYSIKDRAIIAGTTALGVAGGLAILSKCAGYSLNPKKMFKNFKGSYLYKAPYDEKEIITMGAGASWPGPGRGNRYANRFSDTRDCQRYTGFLRSWEIAPF